MALAKGCDSEDGTISRHVGALNIKKAYEIGGGFMKRIAKSPDYLKTRYPVDRTEPHLDVTEL
jgi:hypothetical protein